ncbi:MAG: hypothetical protein ACFB11_17575 [Paracoccaceae bacterium]
MGRGCYSDQDDPGFIAFGDDEINWSGPFCGPSFRFSSGVDAVFAVVVTNFASGPNAGGDRTLDQNIILNIAPAPVGISLLLADGAVLGGIGARHRRKPS